MSAYALGIRHAFDADHIAAIDNATRRLISAGHRPMSVGFWFALGHSTIVVAAVVLLVGGMNIFMGSAAGAPSALTQITDIWGAAISGLFLTVMGVLNFGSLRGLRALLARMRAGTDEEADLDQQLDKRGLLSRLLRPFTTMIIKPSRMFPVGLLFGLGLDTAASISLFVIAGLTTPNLPGYVVLVLPILFTAGMTLFDTTDGVIMNHIYGWASLDPFRKIFYNLIVTGISVLIAFLIGGIGIITAITGIWKIQNG
ncbi:MAG: HoxN/HupN/NixA family nickel/cobalt transporter, partial [Lacisediminihabitans sp.]